jgi:hypothetical protein
MPQDLVAAERLVHLDELDGVLDAGRAVLSRVPAVLVVRVRGGLRAAGVVRRRLARDLRLGRLRLGPALAADQRWIAVVRH